MIAVLVSDLLVKKSSFGIGSQEVFVDDLADIKVFVNGAVFEFDFKGRCRRIVPNRRYIARVDRNSVHFVPDLQKCLSARLLASAISLKRPHSHQHHGPCSIRLFRMNHTPADQSSAVAGLPKGDLRACERAGGQLHQQ